MARDVRVNIIGDSRPLERAFDRSSRATKQFGGSLAVVDRNLAKVGAGRAALIGGFAGAGAGIIAPKVIDQLMQAVDVASNLNEQTSRSRVVFGQSSAAIEAWARTTASSIGIANDQALEFVGTFGALFANTGSTQQQASDFSRTLVQLAADMASFNNTNVDDALNALRSGLSGEIEPLRRYQVFLTEASVAQRAMQNTGKSNVQQLTQGERIFARYQLILEQTSKQQGDFSRTSEGLANQQRILAANVRDLQANLGRLLLPVMSKSTGALVDATDAALGLADALERIGKIKIPPIHIPFVMDIGGGGGGTVSSALGKAFSVAKFFGPGGFTFVIKDIADKIADRFKDDAAGEVTILANEFARSINTMTTNALDLANRNAPKVKLTPAIEFDRLPGIDTGTPLAEQFGAAVDKFIAVAKQQSADAIRKGKAAVAKEARDAAREKQRGFFDALIDAIGLKVDQAAARKGFADDLAANTQLQNAIKQQIRVEGRTTELASMLFDARRERARIIADQRAALADVLQARQFRALGLSDTGEPRIPGVENLRKQFESLSKRVVVEGLSGKLVSQLKAAGRVLNGQFGKVTEETRRAIVQLFETIRGTFDQESRQGPFTRGSAINAGKILEGLGLPPDIEATIRARLSRLNSVAGIASAGRTGRRGTATTATGQPIVVESHTTVVLDGEIIGKTVTKSQQRARRRNPTQKRGPNRNV